MKKLLRLNKEILQDLCLVCGVRDNGTKQEMIARIIESGFCR